MSLGCLRFIFAFLELLLESLRYFKERNEHKKACSRRALARTEAKNRLSILIILSPFPPPLSSIRTHRSALFALAHPNSFEENAASQCDALIARALTISPSDPDALLTLASIQMSESKPEEAQAVVLGITRTILGEVERLRAEVPDLAEAELADLMAAAANGEEDISIPEISSSGIPPVPTRATLVRLLLEFGCYSLALRIVDTIRAEDELDVEGSYLEAWTWYLRAEAKSSGQEKKNEEERKVEEELGFDKDGDEEVDVKECYEQALGSAMECVSVSLPSLLFCISLRTSLTISLLVRYLLYSYQLHQEQDYPDEGILIHCQELIDTMEKNGVSVPIEEEGDVDEEEQGEDMDTT